ncbi:MAG: response regulator [Myxococcales bacterium]|nr:response regulator [Myxococcales bacterium]MCB9547481.1 response regulator [Myxococcales bacterium]
MTVRMHILLAEDEESDVLITRRALQRCEGQPVELEVVRDGQELLDRLRGMAPFEGLRRPDLILLDFNLPKVNGLEALQIIKQDADLRALPVLMLTTSERPEEIEASYAHGANAFVVKPIRFARFVEVMDGLLKFWGDIARLPGMR